MGVAIKLVVDMWLAAGPAASLALALLLLRRCYGSPRPALRRRAFDLLANLMVCFRTNVCRSTIFICVTLALLVVHSSLSWCLLTP